MHIKHLHYEKFLINLSVDRDINTHPWYSEDLLALKIQRDVAAHVEEIHREESFEQLWEIVTLKNQVRYDLVGDIDWLYLPTAVIQYS